MCVWCVFTVYVYGVCIGVCLQCVYDVCLRCVYRCMFMVCIYGMCVYDVCLWCVYRYMFTVCIGLKQVLGILLGLRCSSFVLLHLSLLKQGLSLGRKFTI